MEYFNTKFVNENSVIVFFHLETSGFEKTDDILQIICKCNDSIFSAYIHPTQPISDRATEANGLRNINGKLYFRHKRLKTQSLKRVLSRLLIFLQEFEKPCILVAHNLNFHYPRLIKAIQMHDLDADFSSVIQGFVNTLPLFRKKFPNRRGTGLFRLTTLASDYLLDISLPRIQNGKLFINLLEILALKYISLKDLLQSQKKFSCLSKKVAQSQRMNFDDQQKIANEMRLCIKNMWSDLLQT